MLRGEKAYSGREREFEALSMSEWNGERTMVCLVSSCSTPTPLTERGPRYTPMSSCLTGIPGLEFEAGGIFSIGIMCTRTRLEA